MHAASFFTGALAALAASSAIAAAPLSFDTSSPACTSLTPTAIGGAAPPPSVLSLRWLGTTNFELVYRNQVILLDTYYDRGPRNRPIGFTPSQVTRANAIYIGHGHFDHMSDAVSVAAQTRAPVIGAPTAIDKALSMGLPQGQAVTVRGAGETQRYNGFTVQAILAQHSTLAPNVLSAFQTAITAAIGAPTPDQSAAEAAILARGTFDPRVFTEGTIAYLFTFDNGFKLIYRNSAGPITDTERAAMARIGGTDVAIVAYIGQYAAERQIAATLPIVKLYNPRLYLPAHHDEIAGTFLDIGTEPMFMAIRDQMPGTKSLSPLYREPVCINVDNDFRTEIRNDVQNLRDDLRNLDLRNLRNLVH
ncbi:MBL fold metallo-hydrolase [Noviherbaspirillum pedocola]|uniref:MBL fold metallo-hydrolase n=1 Tax=Noviherbaspirillum pedocola TaxID=2801341 RepID=A0A934W3T5_9BURK|nr:MBL fold metallo-hydrolase [Noviherbaspirillum pedocola]MBK4737786.1 MBL fold metallo-hydrolase [Noviherbaspirillum pedocola]